MLGLPGKSLDQATPHSQTELRSGHAFGRVQVQGAGPGPLQITSTAGGPGAEHEADRAADAVAGAPDASLQTERGREPLARALPAGPTTGDHRPRNVASTGGEPLPQGVQDLFALRMGHHFGRVRVHADSRAAQLAQLLQARAFAYGQDIFFGRNEYAPRTHSGLHLLAHELSHVVQQQHPVIQRQQIPAELMSSVDVRTLTDEQLQERYDLIASTLAAFQAPPAEAALLKEEAGRIGIELSRRKALAAGRTFSPEAIERMRNHFIANATSPDPASCIATLNRGVRLLLDVPTQQVGSEVQTTMGKLEALGLAGPARVIEFEDSSGRVTSGTREPQRLHESVWDTLVQMAGGDPGWSVFGLSLMDGYHSVTLTLDNNDPSTPRVYWSDQWSSRGGWQEFNRGGLDAEITRLTRQWWKEKPQDRKPRTRTTLWRLRSTASVPAAPAQQQPR
jgi:hypothetical protein